MILVTGATGKQFEDVARHCGSLQGDVPVPTRNSVGRERPSDGVHRWTNTRPRHLARAVFATFRTIAVPSGNTIGSDAEWRYAVGGAERDRQAARRS
jgi:hypothetical protein